jgi:DNA (cytosine-5)-methyltransferase 1
MNNINSNIKEMDLTKLSKAELLVKCEEHGITRCKSKNKSKLIELINEKQQIQQQIQSNILDIVINDDEIAENTSSEIVTISDVQTNYTLVDLFCGTGAFSYAFHQTEKVKTIFANDMLDSSEKIFNLNNNIKLTKQNLIDIEDSNIPKSDIITAGFPCQPFSIAGMQKGFDDERSNVFWKILSIVKNNNPKIVILENVKNLQSHDDGNTFKIIIDNLEKLNYYIKYSILNTSKITGIPQNRERIYIVCFKDKIMYDNFDFNFPEIDLKPITEFLENNIPEKYYYNDSTIIYNELETNVIKHITTNTIYQYRRYYVRENKNNVCPTLTANMGSGGHNVPIILDDKGIRKLTPRECFNLQGFPSNYKLPSISTSKLYSLAGNAVSIPVVSLISNKISKLI